MFVFNSVITNIKKTTTQIMTQAFLSSGENYLQCDSGVTKHRDSHTNCYFFLETSPCLSAPGKIKHLFSTDK